GAVALFQPRPVAETTGQAPTVRGLCPQTVAEKERGSRGEASLREGPRQAGPQRLRGCPVCCGRRNMQAARPTCLDGALCAASHKTVQGRAAAVAFLCWS